MPAFDKPSDIACVGVRNICCCAMGEEAQARQKKAQRVLAEAFAHAEVTASLEERAKLRANAKMEAELLINVCDYVQADMVRSSTRQLHMCRSCACTGTQGLPLLFALEVTHPQRLPGRDDGTR